MNGKLRLVSRGLWTLAGVIGGASLGLMAASLGGGEPTAPPGSAAPTRFILAPDALDPPLPLTALALPPVSVPPPVPVPIPEAFGPTPQPLASPAPPLEPVAPTAQAAASPPAAKPLPRPAAPKPENAAPAPTLAAETILISVADRRLRVTLADGSSRSFPIAVGRSRDLIPIGTTEVTRKRRDPTWVPTPTMRRKDPTLPASVPPGPRNPMGRYALDLGWTYYRIHGTNEPESIGRAASSGCFRMLPKDIEAVYALVGVGTRVTVIEGRLPKLPDPSPPLPETKAL